MLWFWCFVMLYDAQPNTRQHGQAPCHWISKNLLKKWPLCCSNVCFSCFLCQSVPNMLILARSAELQFGRCHSRWIDPNRSWYVLQVHLDWLRVKIIHSQQLAVSARRAPWPNIARSWTRSAWLTNCNTLSRMGSCNDCPEIKQRLRG